MSVQMQKKVAAVVFGVIHNFPSASTPAARIYRLNCGRSCSTLFASLFASLRKCVSSASAPSTSDESSEASRSLQDGKAALQGAESCEGLTAGCVLAGWQLPDPARLARILGALQGGQKLGIHGLNAIVGGSFKTFSSDLHTLIHVLKLPVQRTKRCVKLLAPVSLCQGCAHLGEQLRQTEQFTEKFRAALPANAGCIPFRVLSEGRQGERPLSSNTC